MSGKRLFLDNEDLALLLLCYLEPVEISALEKSSSCWQAASRSYARELQLRCFGCERIRYHHDRHHRANDDEMSDESRSNMSTRLLFCGGPALAVAFCRTRLEALGRGRAAAAGTLHSLVVDGLGRVHAFGHGGEGRLGLGLHKSTCCTPRLVPLPYGGRRVAQVAAARRHSVALCVDGAVYSWGSNARGQLGHGPPPPGGSGGGSSEAGSLAVALHAPREVTALYCGSARIVEVCCGDDHTLFLASDGRLRACGAKECVGLGDSSIRGDAHSPTLLWRLADERVFITRVAAAGSHSLALSSEGRVYSWGIITIMGDSNMMHDDGDDELLRVVRNNNVPTLVSCSSPGEEDAVSLIACGAECCCAYSAGSRRMWMWGLVFDDRDLSYLADHVPTEEAVVVWRRPRRVAVPEDEDLAVISAGGGFCIAAILVTKKQHCYQLCRGSAREQEEFFASSASSSSALLESQRLDVDLSGVVSAASAEEHYLLCTADGRVHTAGNGGHGRIGQGSHASSLEPKLLTTVPG